MKYFTIAILERPEIFTTPTKNHRPKRNITSEYTMLRDVLTANFGLRKNKKRIRYSNHSLIVSWFQESIPARSSSIIPYVMIFLKSHFAMRFISKE